MVNQKFLIKELSPFLSYLDEKSFFLWLESIRAVKGVAGKSAGLELTLETPLDEESLRDLIAILHRYNLEMSGLARFLSESNEGWFKSRDAYWYDAVFPKEASQPD